MKKSSFLFLSCIYGALVAVVFIAGHLLEANIIYNQIPHSAIYSCYSVVCISYFGYLVYVVLFILSDEEKKNKNYINEDKIKVKVLSTLDRVSNKNHPERKEDEVFFNNSSFENFAKINWKTKRMGKRAYNLLGEEIKRGREYYSSETSAPISDVFPVFVKKSEVIKKNGGDEMIKIVAPCP